MQRESFNTVNLSHMWFTSISCHYFGNIFIICEESHSLFTLYRFIFGSRTGRSVLNMKVSQELKENLPRLGGQRFTWYTIPNIRTCMIHTINYQNPSPRGPKMAHDLAQAHLPHITINVQESECTRARVIL